MPYGNLFHELRDKAFNSVLHDYEVWEKTGVITAGGVFAKIRNNYANVEMMQRHLLNECVVRLQRQYKQQKGV